MGGRWAVLAALLLLAAVAQPATAQPKDPDADEGIRIVEADWPRHADRVRIGGPTAR